MMTNMEQRLWCCGLLNAIELQNKRIEDCKIVCIGAGAAGIATAKLKAFGAKHMMMLTAKA